MVHVCAAAEQGEGHASGEWEVRVSVDAAACVGLTVLA